MSEIVIVDRNDILLEAPFSMAVSGPTSCGKTFWVFRFLKGIAHMVSSSDVVPRKILFCFSIEQALYSEI